VGPRAVLDAVVKRKISIPRRESNPRTPIDRKNAIYKSVRLHVALYECEAKSLALKEKRRWGALRTIGHVTDVIIQQWGKLHNKKLRNLYSSYCVVEVII
jgi:hypothetical protein